MSVSIREHSVAMVMTNGSFERQRIALKSIILSETILSLFELIIYDTEEQSKARLFKAEC